MIRSCLSALLVFSLLFCSAPSFAQDKEAQAAAKEQIMAAEKALCKMAKEQGIEAAFLAYAADDAVIFRANRMYKGKDGIKKYYANKDKADQLTWKPSYVSVSAGGDMGYTYGEYDFSGIRVGQTMTDHGMCHTIWQKQKDGSWKFVLNN